MTIIRKNIASRLLGLSFILALFALISSCSSSDIDEMPQTLQTFVTQYWPHTSVSSYTDQNGVQQVKLLESATLTFNADNQWTDINGNGATIPAQLLFDQLPETLYNYLVTLEATTDVYRLHRDSSEITVTLHNSTLSYDLTTHTIIYPAYNQ